MHARPRLLDCFFKFVIHFHAYSNLKTKSISIVIPSSLNTDKLEQSHLFSFEIAKKISKSFNYVFIETIFSYASFFSFVCVFVCGWRGKDSVLEDIFITQPFPILRCFPSWTITFPILLYPIILILSGYVFFLFSNLFCSHSSLRLPSITASYFFLHISLSIHLVLFVHLFFSQNNLIHNSSNLPWYLSFLAFPRALPSFHLSLHLSYLSLSRIDWSQLEFMIVWVVLLELGLLVAAVWLIVFPHSIHFFSLLFSALLNITCRSYCFLSFTLLPTVMFSFSSYSVLCMTFL